MNTLLDNFVCIRRSLWFLRATLPLSVALIAWPVSAQKSLTGKVSDDHGDVPPNVSIVAYHADQGWPKPKGVIRTFATAPATADGSFVLPVASAGHYYVCAYPGRQGWISNCQWAASANSVEVGEAEAEHSVPIVLHKGGVITIQVTDPYAKISAVGHFNIGVMNSDGYYQPAVLTANTAGKRTYQVTIPMSEKVLLFIDSNLQIADAGGKAVAAGRPSTIALKGADSPTLSLSVQ
jgi:hypothetical protein